MLQNEIGSQKWRLNNLYHIIDEQGSDVLFKMRPQQEQFFDEFWYFNIILKARQLGFTTFIDIMGLDYTIFKPNFTTVIIAETKEKAADIFSAKVVHPYEQLPKVAHHLAKHPQGIIQNTLFNSHKTSYVDSPVNLPAAAGEPPRTQTTSV